MKKIFLSVFLIFSSCSMINDTSSIIDPAILKSVDGLLFTHATETSFIFFADNQQVLIHERNSNKGSYYKLIDGQGSTSGAISFRLSGWGSYHDSYISLKTLIENGIVYAGVSVQKSRTTAVNAIQFLTSSRTMTRSKVLKSPALYTLAASSPIVKTSIAGIFKPADSQFMTFKYGDEESLTVNGSITIQDTDQNTGATTVINQDLIYQKNINSTTTIYSYNNSTSGDITLYGIRIDMKSSYPRLAIITNSANYNTLTSTIAEVERELSRVTKWNYGIFDAIRVTDGSLIPFLDKVYLEYIANENTSYSILEHSQWFLDSKEDTIRITKRSRNNYTEEDYLLAPTSKSGVFELLDHQALGNQEYSGKFFNITAQDRIINKISIYDNLNNINKPIATFLVKNSTALTAKRPVVENAQSRHNAILGTNTSGTLIGRSAFQAYMDKSTGKIFLAGGYTNSQRLHRGAPRRETSSATLPRVYNNIYEISGINSATPTYRDTGLKLNPNNPDNLNFQQAIGTITKATSLAPREIFWFFGAGAIGTEKVSYNPLSPNRWITSQIAGNNFDNFYHQMIVSHLGELFILGGTKGTSSVIGDINGPEDLGAYTNRILVAPAVANMNANVWSTLTLEAEWAGRIHGNVFSVGKTMVLVGGMVKDTTTDPVTIIPTNDVWISENSGRTWTNVNVGGTPSTTAGTTSAPPVQEDSKNGPLAGTVLNGIIYLMAEDRTIYYSYDKGTTWYVSAKFGSTGNIYGTQMVANDNKLFLIGGQSTIAPSTVLNVDNMNKSIEILSIR